MGTIEGPVTSTTLNGRRPPRPPDTRPRSGISATSRSSSGTPSRVPRSAPYIRPTTRFPPRTFDLSPWGSHGKRRSTE
ncbi:hypothetical protein GCM10010298_26000 [Streptomyces microflavus]|nr:hypothetical protein GCM10010298_26000 [Streptomyces microflavus]